MFFLKRRIIKDRVLFEQFRSYVLNLKNKLYDDENYCAQNFVMMFYQVWEKFLNSLFGADLRA